MILFFLILISKGLSSTCSNKINTESNVIGNFEYSNCQELVGSLEILEKITEIGNYAFFNCTNLNGSLILHNSINKIGDHAFDRCTNLTGSLILPNCLRTLGEGAFFMCEGFTGSLKIPIFFSSIIPKYCFYQCSGLNELIFTNEFNDDFINYKKQHSNDSLFQKVTSIYYISTPFVFLINTINSDIKDIEEYAFYKCTGLKTISLPNSIENIKEYAFYGCLNLEKINILKLKKSSSAYLIEQSDSMTFPGNIKTIGNFAFSNCAKLKGPLNIPQSLNKIGENAFSKCNSIEGPLSILGSTIIGSHSFYDCSSFSSLKLSNTISHIGEYAFYGCTGFNCTLEIPKNLNVINDYAF